MTSTYLSAEKGEKIIRNEIVVSAVKFSGSSHNLSSPAHAEKSKSFAMLLAMQGIGKNSKMTGQGEEIFFLFRNSKAGPSKKYRNPALQSQTCGGRHLNQALDLKNSSLT
jgi:hypothetical protein